MEMDQIKIAKRIKESREKKGYTQQEAVDYFNEKFEVSITKDTLKNYECDKENSSRAGKVKGMRIEYLFYLADLFGVSTDYLLGISDNPNIDPSPRAITKKYGLKNEVLEELEKYHNNKSYKKLIVFLNLIIENEIFVSWAEACMDYLTVYALWDRRKQLYKKKSEKGMGLVEFNLPESIEIKDYKKTKAFNTLIDQLANDPQIREYLIEIFEDGIPKGFNIETQENFLMGFPSITHSGGLYPETPSLLTEFPE